VITGNGKAAEPHEAAKALENFEGIELDAEAQAAITAALEACAERYRADKELINADDHDAVAILVDDPAEDYVPACKDGNPYHGELYPPTILTEYVPFQEGESHWAHTGAELPYWAQPEEVQQARRERAAQEAAELAEAEAEAAAEAEMLEPPDAPDTPSGATQSGKGKSNGKPKGPATTS
jgi:hypothetical protein